MDKLVCKHCGNVVTEWQVGIMSDVEFHDDKPYDVTYIECPKCGKSIYLYNEFEESSETKSFETEKCQVFKFDEDMKKDFSRAFGIPMELLFH